MNRGNREIFSSSTSWPKVFVPKKGTLRPFRLLFLCLAIFSQPVSAEVSFKDFGFKLYEQAAPQGENFALGPSSVGQALAMAGVGAKGRTEEQFSKVLGFRPAVEVEGLRHFQSTLRGEKVTILAANRAWLDSRLEVLPAYRDALGPIFASTDYGQSEKARGQINGWVAEATQDNIEELLPQGSLNDLTRLVLTNAIYFKGAWQFPFDKRLTQERPFKTPSGKVTVPTMKMTATLSYWEHEGHQVVVLPFRGRRWGMMIVLPPRGGDWKPSAHQAVLAQFFDAGSARVTLSLPRFKVRGQAALKGHLSRIGLGSAFDESSDFRGIDGTRKLMISEVFHEATVAVDEEGAEASAATAAVIGLRGLPKSVEMKVDRPFGFAIVNLESEGAEPLFLGQVARPE